MTSAQPVARRSARRPVLAAALLAIALAACGTGDGATSVEEALALEEANAAAQAIQAKGGSDSTSSPGITFSPSTVVAGQPVTVTVSFAGGSAPVYVGYPASALAGLKVARTRSFTLVTNPYLATTTTAFVTARTTSPYPAATATATLTIVPGPLAGGTLPRVASVQLGAASVTSGTPVSAVLTLSSAAPAGGLAVQVGLSNDRIMKDLDVPVIVTVPAGATSAAFTVRTHLTTTGLTTLTDYVVANVFGGLFSGAAITVTR